MHDSIPGNHASAARDAHPEVAALRRELAQLRSEARAFRAIGLLGAAAATAIGLLAMRNPQPTPVIQTKRLEIVDDAGRVTATVSSTRQGGRLEIWDGSGANTVRLGSNDLGGDLLLWNRAGKRIFSAFAEQSGGQVEVGGPDGRLRIALGSESGGGRAVLFDADGDAVVAAGSTQAGGALRLADAENHDAALIEATSNGGSIALGAPEGLIAARLRTGEAGGELDLAARGGSGRINAAASASGSAVIAASEAGAGKIEATKVGGGVDVLNAKGDRLASLETNDSGGLLVCRAGGDRALASLGGGASAARGGLLQVYNAQQSPVFAAAVTSDGGGRLALGTSAGVATFTAEAGKDDGASLSIVRGGRRSIALLSGANGGILNLFAAGGSAAVIAGTAEDAPGGLVLIRSTEGKDLARLGVDDKGAGNVMLFNKDASKRREVAGPR